MSIDDTSNIFNRGVLLQIQTSMPGYTRQLKEAELQVLTNLDYDSPWVKATKNGNKKWIKGRKMLFDPTELNEVTAVKQRINTDLDAISLNFPLRGIKFIPIRNITRANTILQTGLESINTAIDRFIDAWHDRIYEARDILGTIWNSDDYPSDIRSKFRFTYQFVNLTAPNGAMSMVDQQLYEQEQRKFVEFIEEAKDFCMAALRQEFMELVGHIVERLAPEEGGTPKKFRTSMIANLETFVSNFKDRNVFDDDELQNLVDQAHRAISVHNIEDIRNDEVVRMAIASEMAVVKEAISSAITNSPSRKISLD